jgi:hypothetical protein
MSDADQERVRAVLERHRESLKERYRALGTGIGKRSPQDPTLVIVVYLESERDRPADAQFVEDVPLKFEVTGPIRLF